MDLCGSVRIPPFISNTPPEDSGTHISLTLLIILNTLDLTGMFPRPSFFQLAMDRSFRREQVPPRLGSGSALRNNGRFKVPKGNFF